MLRGEPAAGIRTSFNSGSGFAKQKMTAVAQAEQILLKKLERAAKKQHRERTPPLA
jgi:hypothetical protein